MYLNFFINYCVFWFLIILKWVCGFSIIKISIWSNKTLIKLKITSIIIINSNFAFKQIQSNVCCEFAQKWWMSLKANAWLDWANDWNRDEIKNENAAFAN